MCAERTISGSCAVTTHVLYIPDYLQETTMLRIYEIFHSPLYTTQTVTLVCIYALQKIKNDFWETQRYRYCTMFMFS